MRQAFVLQGWGMRRTLWQRVLNVHGVCNRSLRGALHVCTVQSALRAIGTTVKVHSCFLWAAGTCGRRLFDRDSKHCEQTCGGTQLCGVGAMALR